MGLTLGSGTAWGFGKTQAMGTRRLAERLRAAASGCSRRRVPSAVPPEPRPREPLRHGSLWQFCRSFKEE
ncbi:hypothetical protein AV530_004023 [Patagioenas fasciata monilis]|uniref:Uncharacterized protein n=1 Tax=Patagioenas fasciata monilis TaxID=372326 RepID=A0A1V4JVZ7_PATFA|nr:hypothetical protein AV530_004023 [Patagioenas fasciata monilis]